MSGDAPRWTAREFLAGLASLAFAGAAAGQTGQSATEQDDAEVRRALSFPRCIILVRHAEKAASGGDDPALSDAGEGRARRLADMLRASGVSHLFASEFLRTKATLAPLSVALQRTIVSVPARDQGALLSALESLPRGSVAVVAGHSNTVPALVEKLAQGRAKTAIEDSEYDKLFVVVQWGAERGQQFTLELRF